MGVGPEMAQSSLFPAAWGGGEEEEGRGPGLLLPAQGRLLVHRESSSAGLSTTVYFGKVQKKNSGGCSSEAREIKIRRPA